MKKILISILVAALFLCLTSTAIFAASSQDITIEAIPTYVSISNSPDAFEFSPITASVNATTGSGYFTVVNSSSVNITAVLVCETWSSASPWSYGYSAPDIGQLWASANTSLYDKLIPISGNVTLYSTTSAGENFTWEMKIETPSSFTNPQMTQTSNITVTVWAS